MSGTKICTTIGIFPSRNWTVPSGNPELSNNHIGKTGNLLLPFSDISRVLAPSWPLTRVSLELPLHEVIGEGAQLLHTQNGDVISLQALPRLLQLVVHLYGTGAQGSETQGNTAQCSQLLLSKETSA